MVSGCDKVAPLAVDETKEKKIDVQDETPKPEPEDTPSSPHAYKIEEKRPITEDSSIELRKIKFKGFSLYSIKLMPEKYQAEIFDQPNADRSSSVKKVTEEENALFGINGGYFKASFDPAGLYILDGREQFPINNTESNLSGLLTIDQDLQIDLLPRDTELQDPPYAIQAGPFLIDSGGKMGIQSKGKIALRTVVALSPKKELVIIATTSNVSLYDLAESLHQTPKAFGVEQIDMALNLDGGPSTGLFVNLPDHPISLQEKGPVRNMILFYGSPDPS